MKPRLLCVYQHAPTPGAPGIYRHRILLRELVRRGWDVDLVSTPVNYMTGLTDPRYPGYRTTHETIDGIDHHWVWAPERIHSSKRRRILNYVAFSSLALSAAARLPRPNVILASSPPLPAATVGPALCRRFRRPWVLEVRDVWPESAASVGWLTEESTIYRALEKTAHALAQDASSVIVPTPGLIAPMLRHGARQVCLITGVVEDAPPDLSERAARRAELAVDDTTCVFLYLGSIGVANGLDVLLDAVQRVPRDLAIAIAVVGDGSARTAIEERLVRERIDRIRIVGAVPKTEVGSWLAAADVCLHLLRPDPVFASALPTKVLEYFGAHRPFITTVPGLPERLARRSGGGFASEANGLAAELVRWARLSSDTRQRFGEESFRFGQARFGLQAGVDRLEDLLDQVIAGGPGPTRGDTEPRTG